MKNWDYQLASIGDNIPSLSIKPISRTMLALYAGASGDHNPIHIDIDFAKKSGMRDVIAHGMLIMSFMGRAITNIISQSYIKNFSVKFCSMTQINDILNCSGIITHKVQDESSMNIIIGLSVHDQNKDEKLNSSVEISIPK